MCNISNVTSKKNEIIPKLTDNLSTSAKNVLKSTFARIPSYLVEKCRSQKFQYSTDSLACQHQGTVCYIYKILWSQAFISLHFALQFCIPTWTTPLLYFKPFLEYFTHISLCKAGTRKWNSTGRQYSLLFRKSAVLVIIIKMLQFTK